MNSLPPPGRRTPDEHGGSASAFVAVAMSALFLVAGLVVDGGAQARAHRQAEVVAARAVRSGSDATAARRLVGQDGTADGLAAAQAVLAQERMAGQVTMTEGTLVVETHTASPTIFLYLLGIDQLAADGHASAVLREV